MQRMVRKQVYLGPDQEERLKRKAKETGVPEAEIIRASLDLFFRALERAERAREGAPSAPLMIQEAPALAYRTERRPPVVEEMFRLVESAMSEEGESRGGEALSAADTAAWKEELAFMERRAASGGTRAAGETAAAGRRWTRDELYERD